MTTKEIPVDLSNDSPDRNLDYEIEAPSAPFVVRSGSLSGSIAPGGKATIVFAVQAIPRLSTKQFQDTIYGKLSNPSTPVFSLSLRVLIVSPHVQNFRKVRAFLDDEVALIKGSRLDPATLAADCMWESSTGQLSDLEGAEILELLKFNGIVSDPTSASGFRLPPPFAGRVPASFLDWAAGESRWNAAGRQGSGLIRLGLLALQPNTGCFIDKHGTYPWFLNATSTAGKFSVEQEYVWRAPWMKDGDVEVWTPLLYDRLDREIFFDPSAIRWMYRISSGRATPPKTTQLQHLQ